MILMQMKLWMVVNSEGKVSNIGDVIEHGQERGGESLMLVENGHSVACSAKIDHAEPFIICSITG